MDGERYGRSHTQVSGHCVSTRYFISWGSICSRKSIFNCLPTVMVPDRPITADLLIDIIVTTKTTLAVLPPSLIEEMSRLEEGQKG